jgi:glutathione S-transferase
MASAAAAAAAASAASAAALSLSGAAEAPASGLHHARLNQWPASDRPSILIKYFDAKGVMETSRITMVLGDLPFSETRWPLDVSKMGAGLGSAAPEYMAAKEAGELDANLGRGPVVVVAGEHVLSQSRSIERYLARQLGMMGQDELAAAHIDAFTEHLRDLKEKFQKVQPRRRTRREGSRNCLPLSPGYYCFCLPFPLSEDGLSRHPTLTE